MDQMPAFPALQHPEMPSIVRLELTNSCNLQCPHCRHHSPEKRQPENYAEYYKTPIHMTAEQVTSIFQEVGLYKPSVTLNVANEPLIAPAFRHAVKEVKKHGLVGTFNTNGIALNEEMCHFLCDIQYDSVNISVDAMTPGTLMLARGISRLDHLIRNIERLVAVRGTRKLPRVGVTFVITNYNDHEIEDFLTFWKERVDVIRLTGYITDKRPDITALPGVKREDMPSRVPCKQLFRDIVIRANGDVTPCVITSEDPTVIVGNIFKEGGVRAVWDGAHFNHWRQQHNVGKWGDIPYCSGCDYWIETYNLREEVRDGFLIRSPSPYTVFYNVLDKLENWDRTNMHDRQGMGDAANLGQIKALASYEKN